MIDDPRGAPRDPRLRALSGIAQIVTGAPWTLERADLARAHERGLDDATVLHVIALSSFFGYLNRVADAVGIELDYDVKELPPPPDPSTPPWPRPTAAEVAGLEAAAAASAPRPLELAMRPGAVDALASWSAHALDRDAPLGHADRAMIAGVAAATVGDTTRPAIAPATDRDRALATLTETIALAPWRLGAAALAPVRAAGLDDAAIFDAIAVAAFANFASRLSVALVALAR